MSITYDSNDETVRTECNASSPERTVRQEILSLRQKFLSLRQHLPSRSP